MNGDACKSATLAYARAADPALAAWMVADATRVPFPNSMVDRITPATGDEHRAAVASGFGVADAWPVTAEPFLQWRVSRDATDGRADGYFPRAFRDRGRPEGCEGARQCSRNSASRAPPS
jgi:mannitol-1-phosphate/altronate dehydrogenase